MSRIGKNPVVIGKDVKVEVSGDKAAGQMITLKTSKASQVINLQPEITVTVSESDIVLSRVDDEKQSRAYHGLYRSLLQNAMTGLTEGWSKTLILNGVGYLSLIHI